MHVTKTKTALIGGAFLASSALAGTAAFTSATASSAGSDTPVTGTQVQGQLNPLNNSGVTGRSVVHVAGRQLHVEVDARGLAPNLPHAQHIHYGEQARHECPTVADDQNGDVRLTTSEGAPAYGPVRVSLTKRGDTSADSVLAVNRFPTAPEGEIHYDRDIQTGKAVARAIRQGEGVVVIHGVDYNNNGEYDFDSAGASELNGELPAEATDPAACGVLHH